MATGYTCDVKDGTVTDFADFAMICARAFGACVTMRDEPHGTPIPDEFPPAPYYAEWLQDAKDHLERVRHMNVNQIAIGHVDYRRRQRESYERSVVDTAAVRSRYEAMIRQVEAWAPPTDDHVEFKKFMLSQLSDSLGFDCGSKPTEPVIMSRSEWYDRLLVDAKQSVERPEKNLADEIERCRNRTEWIRALRESLKTRGD